MEHVTFTIIAGPGDVQDKEIDLQRGRTVFGRSPGCDVVLPDSNISRIHFEVVFDDEGVRLKDLESLNGVLLNGVRTTEAAVGPGDVLAAGPYRMRCSLSGERKPDDCPPGAYDGTVCDDQLLSASPSSQGGFYKKPSADPIGRDGGGRTPGPSPPAPRGEQVLAELPAGRGIDAESIWRSGAVEPDVSRDLNAFYRFTEGIVSKREMSDLGRFVTEEAVKMVGADRAAFLLIEEEGGRPRIERAVFFPEKGRFGDASLAISRTVSEKVMREGKAILVKSAGEDERVRSARSIVGFGIQSVICAPLRGRSKTLGLLYADLSGSSIRFTERDLAVFTAAADLTAVAAENLAAWEEVRRLSEKLIASERLAAVGRVSGGVLHDMKNMLSIASLSTEMLQNPSLSQEQRARYSELILEKIDEVVNLTEEVMDYARGTMRLEHRMVRPGDIVGRVVRSLRPTAEKAKVSIEVEQRAERAARLDPNKIYRVLFNLCKNGIEAMKEGGVLRIWSFEDGEDLVMVFEDEGPGVTPQMREKIFEAFVTEGKEKGTGLGLAVSQNIVELHGGSLCVEKSPSGGARFVMRVPSGADRDGDKTIMDYSKGPEESDRAK